MRPDLVRRMLMEAIGTFALVVAGCGAVITDATRDGALGSVGISLVFGLIIMAMIYAGGHLSGAHYNPAVTIAFTIGRHFPIREAASYIAAQLAGALAAALLLLAAWPDQPANLGATLPSVAVGTALVYEIVLTAILMFVSPRSPPTPARSAPPRRSPSAAPSPSMRSSAGRSPARP